MANQDITAMIAELYNQIGGEVGYNNYYIAMGMMETIKTKLSVEFFGNVHAGNVGMEQQQQQQQQPAPNVVVEQQQQQQQQQQPAPNDVVEQGIEQQQQDQNVVPLPQVPIVNLDALGEALQDDWRPFDGQTFDFLSAAPVFWFNKTLTNYMISSCRIRLSPIEMNNFMNGSPPHTFVHSINWRNRSLPMTLLSSRMPAPPTPGLLFYGVEPKFYYLYWPGINRQFTEFESITVTYRWARSRNNGRFLLAVTIEQDLSQPQPSIPTQRQNRATTAGQSHAIGRASGSARPQDRAETSAAGASRARGSARPQDAAETSAAGASRARNGSQLLSSRVLRSTTRGQP